MKFSVITAVRNRVETIEQAVRSVLDQDYSDIEYVIQDGASTDGTLEVLNRLDDPRIVLKSEADSGIYDAINKAMERSTGEVIGLLHSDDFFANPQVLSNIAQCFSPSVDAVYGDLAYVGGERYDSILRQWKAGNFEKAKLRFGWMPPHPTFYVKRGVIERFGNYDTTYEIASDYDAMLRWIIKGQINLSYLPETLVNMRVGGESNRSVERIIRKSCEDYRTIKQNEAGGLFTLAMKNLRKLKQFRLPLRLFAREPLEIK